MRQNVLYGYIRIGNSRSLFQKLSWFLNKFSPEFAIYLNKDMFKIDTEIIVLVQFLSSLTVSQKGQIGKRPGQTI